MARFQAPRGTRDLIPGEIERWQWVEAMARDVFDRYCYDEIRTPMFEDYELFARSSGEASEVVQKEMYRFKDQGDRDLALRPEGTAGVCRAYLEHGLASRGRVHRLWYMGPMFRYGRPQKGRYRQFWQIGAEIIGTPAPRADAEIIALFVDLFEAWGFEDLVVMVNSVGTVESRQAYADRLKDWLAPVAKLLSPESQERLTRNPLRVLDSKHPTDLAILAGKQGGLDPSTMPHMLDELDAESREHFEAVRSELESVEINSEIDHGLVRGLDYYTRTAFEVHDRSLGAQSALGGGGRYDGLIEELGGPATPGVGFSIGVDRVLLAMESRGDTLVKKAGTIFVASTEGTRPAAPAIVRALRAVYAVDHDLEARSLSSQMKSADKVEARVVMILGEDEWKQGQVVLRDMKTGSQTTANLDEMVESIDRILGSDREVESEEE
jgi:histidyl-tRNA synthetase